MPERLRTFHATLGIAAGALFVVFATTSPSKWRRVDPPEDFAGLARYIASHPTDPIAAAKVDDDSLDAPIAKRLELWHAAHALGLRVAPYRSHAAIAFARSGVFHWSELSAAERQEVLASIGPLLHDPQQFSRIYRPVWELTGDFALIDRYAPRDEDSLGKLIDLAATNGRFDEYRRLRGELRKVRDERLAPMRATMTQAEILRWLPVPLRKADEPALVASLVELHRRPLDEEPQQAEAVNRLIDYALAHYLGPLDGLEAITRLPKSADDPQRARLALALDLPDRATHIEIASANPDPQAWHRYFVERAAFEETHGDERRAALYRSKALIGTPERGKWLGTCGGMDVCGGAHAELDGPRRITVETVQTDEVVPYVELYVDDALAGEGTVAPRQVFTLPPGPHHVELRLANPLTRNRIQRRVRIV